METREELAYLVNKLIERLEFAENIAHIGYWEIDFFHKKIYWSKEMFTLFGIDNDRVSFHKNIFQKHILEDDIDIYKSELKKLLKKRRPVSGQLRVRTVHGKIKHCLFKANIISENGFEKIAGTFQDISEFIKKEQELTISKKEAERLSQAKSYFLAQASHDLRQPLQALNIFISALQDENLTSKQHNLVEKISLSTQNLKNLLEGLLDISKLEVGGVCYNESVFDIGILLDRIYNEYANVAEEKGIKLKFCKCHFFVRSDPFLIERIINNLLSNALKYCNKKILLGCKSNNKSVRILVYDDGVGISASDIEKIFDEFYQSKDIQNNRSKGAGLGLSIVKKIATILNTKINVKSVVGKYSCFYFDIPKK